MDQVLLQQAIKLNKERKRKQRWNRFVRSMAAVVVFCTTYALILPAITMHTDTICQLEEHSHSESCYEQLLVCTLEETEGHSHTEECFLQSSQMVCPLTEAPGHTHEERCYGISETPLCGQEEREAHTHEAACLGEPILSCGSVETSGHRHGETCYEMQLLDVCGMIPSEPHTHADGCYEEIVSLICGMEASEEHSHSENCENRQKTLICTLEESAGHAHTEACQQMQQVLICSQPEVEAHTHVPACFIQPVICGTEETEGHSHSESCFRQLICTTPEEAGHTHDENCVVITREQICTLEAVQPHIHEAGCTEERLICQLDEHTHDETCYPETEPMTPTEEGFLCGFGRHSHTEACYGADGSMTCSIPEHSHTAACVLEGYDPAADLESREYWESTLAGVTRTGNWPEDVIAIARSQLGYQESSRNVELQEDGSLKGYTRYGAWYGYSYGDWCAMYVSFCMDYAGVAHMPLEAGCQSWINQLSELGFYRPAQGYTPKTGDIIFFDWEGDENSDHVGLVTQYIQTNPEAPASVMTIEGNSANRVQELTYEANDPVIMGYGVMPKGNNQLMVSEGPDYTVSVSFNADALIPADAELAVREILPGTEEYDGYYAQAFQAVQDASEDAMDKHITFARFFDISFLVAGQVMEPSAPVCVSISYQDPVAISPDESSVAVHFAQEGIEILDAQTAPQESSEELTDTFIFTQNSFSVTGTVITDSGVAARAGNINLSNAINLSDCITSIRVLNGQGSEVKFFAHGDTFRIVIEGMVYNYQFSGNSRTLYFTLGNNLKITAYGCSQEVSDAAIDAGSNTFIMVVPAVMSNNSYQSVPFQVELTGQAVNQSGNVVYTTIRWDQYQIYSQKQEFTYTTPDGAQAQLQIMGNSYSPNQYSLVVEQMDASGQMQNLSNFLQQNYNRRKLEGAVMYKVYLVSKYNSYQQIPIPAPYVLSMSYTESPLEIAPMGSAVALNMNNNSPSKPTSSSAQVTAGGVTLMSISDQYNSLSQFALVSMGGITEGTTGSGYKLSYNHQADAFIKDPAYDAYFNENSPIGTAGSFHIVAFETANLETHTNGNVLAKNLYAGSNFGTNNYGMELTYVQNYLRVNSNSASSENHILVVGSSNEIGFYDNNNKYTINNQPLDRPKNLVQDADTETAPFIDLERVRAEITQIGNRLVGFSDANLLLTAGDQKNVISLTDPDEVGILNVDPTNPMIFGKDYIQLAGFRSGHDGSIVINVDCTGYTEINMPKALVVVDGQEQGTNEVTEFSNGKVLWNFINAQGVTINTHLMTGMVIAPGATVNVMQNLNGTVVADNVNIKAESHRTDFTGKIVPNTKGDGHSVTIQKTRTGYVGTTLADAHFELYVWNGQWTKVGDTAIITDSNGLFQLKDLAVNTAYRLVETRAPNGYVLLEEPIYFWIPQGNAQQPTVRPNGFKGVAVTSGSIMNVANEPQEEVPMTSIELHKVWNTDQAVDINRVEITIYQITWRNGEEVARQAYRTVTLSKVLKWRQTVTNLPLKGKDHGGNEVAYTYAVLETPVDGFFIQYSIDNRTGSTEGTVVITNTPASQQGYVLPETGGVGTQYYTFSGVLLIASALMYLLILKRARRRGERY